MAWWGRASAQAEKKTGGDRVDVEVAPANDQAPRPQTDGASLDDALTTLSSVLRTLGQLRFPIGDEEKEFSRESEDWARHVMTGGKPPSERWESGRDWRGVREHVRARRVAERDYIDARIRGFTIVITDVISQLQGLAGYSDQGAQRLNETMAQLGQAADDASLEELRGHVRRAVRGVRDAVESQRSQFSTKVVNMGERLAAVHQDLDEACAEAKLDPLTQLYTGAALEAELDRGGRVAELSGLHLSLVSLTIDDFELYGLNHGLEAANNVLRAVADCISLCFFRKSDFVARQDEHSFAILLWDTDLQEAERGADRLLQKLRRLRVPTSDKPFVVSVSIGVGLRTEGEARNRFINRVDGAVGHARTGGGDRRESC